MYVHNKTGSYKYFISFFFTRHIHLTELQWAEQHSASQYHVLPSLPMLWVLEWCVLFDISLSAAVAFVHSWQLSGCFIPGSANLYFGTINELMRIFMSISFLGQMLRLTHLFYCSWWNHSVATKWQYISHQCCRILHLTWT